MARVTVEDCIDKVPNRFDLVIFSAERVRQILSGAPCHVMKDNDKNPVIALREIAAKHVSPETLRDQLIRHHQKITPISDEEDDEIQDLMSSEQGWISEPDSAQMQEEMSEDLLNMEDEDALDLEPTSDEELEEE